MSKVFKIQVHCAPKTIGACHTVPSIAGDGELLSRAVRIPSCKQRGESPHHHRAAAWASAGRGATSSSSSSVAVGKETTTPSNNGNDNKVVKTCTTIWHVNEQSIAQKRKNARSVRRRLLLRLLRDRQFSGMHRYREEADRPESVIIGLR